MKHEQSHEHVQQSTSHIQGNPFHWKRQQYTINCPQQHIPTKMQHVSLRLAASILHDSLHGESRICCLRHHRENGNSNKTTKQHHKTTQSRLSDKTPTLIHPGYRVTSPKTLKTLMNVTWLQRLVFPRHNRKRFSRTPKHPLFADNSRTGLKSTTMASEPRADTTSAIL